jgi:hypothetical protein
MKPTVMEMASTEPRSAVPVWRFTAALVAVVAGLAGAKIAAAPGKAALGHATAENQLAWYLQASQRAQADARRCSRELRALTVQHPAISARALEIDGDAIVAAGGVSSLPALTSQAIETSVASVERAVRQLAEMAEVGTAAAGVALSDMGETTARAHRAADRLCDARQVVSAATLTPPVLTRERLTSMP